MRGGGMRLGGASGLLPRNVPKPGGARVRLELGVAHLEGGRLHTLHLHMGSGLTYKCTPVRRETHRPKTDASVALTRWAGGGAGIKIRPVGPVIQKIPSRTRHRHVCA